MSDLVELIRALSRRIDELERRSDNLVRHGTVEEVDTKKQEVRLRIGGTDEEPLISPWVPYGQIAGALKLHSPPSKGQQMTMISPAGDFRQAGAYPFTWSNANPSPSDKPDEHVLTFGGFTFTLKGNALLIKGPKITFEAGGSSWEIVDGSVTAKSGGTEHKISDSGETTTGGRVEHDGKNIGKDHKHRDVTPGPSLTGGPVE